MTATIETFGAKHIVNQKIVGVGWKHAKPPQFLGYCFDARFVKDEDGVGYVATIVQLPGVVGQGDDFASTMSNLIEAFRETVAAYKDEKMPIPWKNERVKTDNKEFFRVAVNV